MTAIAAVPLALRACASASTRDRRPAVAPAAGGALPGLGAVIEIVLLGATLGMATLLIVTTLAGAFA